MPNYNIVGYEPHIEEVMKDMGVNSADEIRPTLLNKLNSLRDTAQASGNIKRFPESPYEFIICDSSDFYRTLVCAGHGSMAMRIKDEWGTEVFFLLFQDRVPEKFYSMPVTHESTEHAELEKNVEPNIAHQTASIKEIQRAEELGKKHEYTQFLKDNFPGKYDELRDINLI